MENRTRRNEIEVLYVYDRICPKESKKRELYKQYGVRRSSEENVKNRAERTRANNNARHKVNNSINGGAVRQNNGRTSGAPSTTGAKSYSDTRTFDKVGGSNAEQRRARSNATAQKRSGRSAPRTNYHSASSNYNRRGNASRVYSYRPESPRGAETVSARPMRLLLERFINFFESVEERGRRDENSAKRQAIARKKIYEYRHTIGTALLILLILAVFIFLVYKLFFVISDIDANATSMYTENGVISASGILEGDNLYSFSADDAVNRITFICPYIKTARITRTVPNTVSITVEEDTAMYVTEIFGERVLLSAGLRVLGSERDHTAGELTELVLPPVDYSVAGRVIEFADVRNERYIRDVLASIANDPFFEISNIDVIDFTRANDIQMCVSGKYLLKLGSEIDCGVKLRMAETTLNNESFDKTKPATIDLSKVGEASVRYDPKLFEN